MIKGIDVSSHQPVINWAMVAAAGYEFAVIKITGGKSYVNPYWREQYEGARAAGLEVGLYHYDGEPTVATGTAAEEAAHFLAHLPDPLPPEVFLALDAEERGTRDIARYADWYAIVAPATGKLPYFYTFQSFVAELHPDEWQALAIRSVPLWFAWYPADIADIEVRAWPVAPAPWGHNYRAWQYSGGTAIPGIPNATDANLFNGTRAELTGHVAPPPTPPVLELPDNDSDNPAAWHCSPTDKWVINPAFLDFWVKNGGLPIFGLPITGEIATDGDTRTAQYFERARFEQHEDGEVHLGLVGAELNAILTAAPKLPKKIAQALDDLQAAPVAPAADAQP